MRRATRMGVTGAALLLAGCSLLVGDGSDVRSRDGGHGDGGAAPTFDITGYAYGAGQSTTTGLQLADLNGDGLLDIAIANGAESSLGVLLGVAGGTFKSVNAPFPACGGDATNPSSTPSGVAVGDFNHDGSNDVAVSCNPSATAAGALSVFLNTTTAGAALSFARVEQTSLGFSIAGVRAFDFDGDGNLDLVVNDTSAPLSGSGFFSIFYGNRDGTFAAPMHFMNGYTDAADGFAIGDFDKDGRPDLALNFSSDAKIRTFLNRPGPRSILFSPTRAYALGTAAPGALVAADLDGDAMGADDLAMVTSDLFNGTANLGTVLNPYLPSSGPVPPAGPLSGIVTTYGTDPGAISLGVSDFDGDGTPDVAVGCYTNPTTSDPSNTAIDLFLNQRGGALGARLTVAMLNPFIPNVLAVGDLNGDHLADLVVAASSGSYATRLYVLINTSH